MEIGADQSLDSQLVFNECRWEKEGLEGLLFDDGIDCGEEVSERTKHTVGVNDLLDALEIKYDILRRKLLFDMLKKNAGKAILVYFCQIFGVLNLIPQLNNMKLAFSKMCRIN